MINENMDKYMTDLTISFLSSIPLMQTIELNEDAKDYGVTKDNFLSFLNGDSEHTIQLSLDEEKTDVVLYYRHNEYEIEDIVIGKVINQKFKIDKYCLMVENKHTFFNMEE